MGSRRLTDEARQELFAAGLTRCERLFVDAAITTHDRDQICKELGLTHSSIRKYFYKVCKKLNLKDDVHFYFHFMPNTRFQIDLPFIYESKDDSDFSLPTGR